MDPGAVVDRAAVPVGPELVGVGPLGVAADVLRPGVPVQELLVVGRVHPGVGVVAQHRGVQPELDRGVDGGEVVGAGLPGVGGRLLVDLVGRVEGEDRVLGRVVVQAQGLLVRRGVGDGPDGERVVVVDLLPGHPLVGRLEPVLEQPPVGVPQHVDDRVLDLRRERAHLGGLGRVAARLVGLRRGQGAAVLVGGLGPVHGAGLPVEGDRVGVVAGQRAPVVLDELVVVVVVVGELTLDVALRVAGEARGDRGLAAVDLVALPGRLRDVLRVAVGPVLRVTRIVEEAAALRRLAHAQPVPVRVGRVAQVLEVVDVHRLGERDRVVVAEDAFRRGRELEGLAGDVRVEAVEAHQPPAVVDVLLDRGFGNVDVRHVLCPPQVVGLDVGGERGRGGVAGVGVVVTEGLWDLVGDEAHHHLDGHRGSCRDRHGPVQTAVRDGEPVAGEPGAQGGQVVVGVDLPGQLAAGARGGVRRRRPQLQCGGPAAVVPDRQIGDGDVVVGDELGLVDRDRAAGVHALPVAGRLTALGDLLGEGARGDRDRVGVVVVDALPVGDVTAEAEHRRVVGLHEQRPSTAHQPGTGRVVAGTGQQTVHPEVGARTLRVVDRPHHVARGVRDGRRRDRGAAERGEPDGLRGVGRGRGEDGTDDERQGEQQALEEGCCSSSHRRLPFAETT